VLGGVAGVRADDELVRPRHQGDFRMHAVISMKQNTIKIVLKA
jgi:hypothetical protein